jgi:hypothetical protein
VTVSDVRGSTGAGNRHLLRVVAAAWMAAGAVLIAVAVASVVLDRSTGHFTRDAVNVLETSLSIGFVSTLGAIVWSVAATACLLVAVIVEGQTRQVFVWGGILTAALLVDDAFLLHEAYAQETGNSEKHVLLVYPVAMAAYVVRFRWFLRRHGLVLLPLALAWFGVSAVLDVSEPGPFLLEDGAKLFGIVTWALFFLWAAVRELHWRVGQTTAAT